MKRYEDLDAELRRVLDEVRQQMTTTVISYPERNPRDRVWGANNYPGNCSGKVALGFIDNFSCSFSEYSSLIVSSEIYLTPYMPSHLNS